MLIVRIKDKSQMLVGVGCFVVQCEGVSLHLLILLLFLSAASSRVDQRSL